MTAPPRRPPTIHAPDLPTQAHWLNVARPLTPADLRGRVVVLHFFTYACINCLHTLPVLAAAERELAGEAVLVVGVHSPKFPTESDPAMVRDALRRHGVTHPVVVDTGLRTWSDYAVKAWPTLVFLRPDGTIHGETSGEPDREPLLGVLRGLLDAHREELDPAPLPLRPEPAPPGVLAYPGGIAVDPAGGDVLVADTGHHQIVVCDGDGAERGRIGSGSPGLADGPSGTARFTSPHGLALEPGGRVLLVADTGNHAVRRVDLDTGEVTTIAGTGRRGTVIGGSGLARRTDLRSPWDVAPHPGGGVVVAMSGSHQLWAVDGIGGPGPAVVGVLAGSGREARVDGDYATAAFAQPSGLAWGPPPPADGAARAAAGSAGAAGGGDSPALYVADSEISAVRRLDGRRVDTVAGGDLFVYGFADGSGDRVRFQHPVGIAAGRSAPLAGLLLVADTLNHAVRTLDPRTRAVRTLFGDGTPFDADLARLERRSPLPADARRAPCCREPEAVADDGTRVLVVDTGNHRVLALDPVTGQGRVLIGQD